MIQNNNKPYVVYSHKMMRHLGEKGFVPFATAPNTKYPSKIVFIYDNSPELIQEIDNYLTETRQAK